MKEGKKIINRKKENFSFLRNTVASTEHTLEQVGVIKDVVYVSDSKSITVKQTCASINMINAEIVLITGGCDSKTDYSFLLDTDVSKIKAIIYTGEDCRRLFLHFAKHYMLLVNAANMKEAVRCAKAYAKKEQVVLFSPACPNFDAQNNYYNRGNEFRKIIQELHSA
jgi:UDP-N-acetylmuramoylalanine--D-glutamate ligase